MHIHINICFWCRRFFFFCPEFFSQMLCKPWNIAIDFSSPFICFSCSNSSLRVCVRRSDGVLEFCMHDFASSLVLEKQLTTSNQQTYKENEKKEMPDAIRYLIHLIAEQMDSTEWAGCKCSKIQNTKWQLSLSHLSPSIYPCACYKDWKFISLSIHIAPIPRISAVRLNEIRCTY